MGDAQQQPEMILLLGLPGAGKSTFVKNHMAVENYPRTRLVINMDDLRLAYGHIYNERLEISVNLLAYRMAETALMRGHSVVIDESVTSLDLAADLVNIAHRHHTEVTMVELDTPLETCRSRRVESGFPRDEFERKAKEWEESREAIIALADVHVRLVTKQKTQRRLMGNGRT